MVRAPVVRGPTAAADGARELPELSVRDTCGQHRAGGQGQGAWRCSCAPAGAGRERVTASCAHLRATGRLYVLSVVSLQVALEATLELRSAGRRRCGPPHVPVRADGRYQARGYQARGYQAWGYQAGGC